MLAAASLELKAEKKSAHSAWVRSVAFSPDGKTIVSSSEDATDAQTLGCRCVGTDTPEPSSPKLSLPCMLQLP